MEKGMKPLSLRRKTVIWCGLAILAWVVVFGAVLAIFKFLV